MLVYDYRIILDRRYATMTLEKYLDLYHGLTIDEFKSLNPKVAITIWHEYNNEIIK
jgi:hypothetical protein